MLAVGNCSCCTTCSGCSMTCSQQSHRDSGNSVCSQCALLKPTDVTSSYDAGIDSDSGCEEKFSFILLVIIFAAL